MTFERRYWDSDCFLGWLAAEEDKIKPCQQVLLLAERSDIEIITSALTLAEVLHLKGKPPLPAEKKEQIVRFFRRSYIGTISVTRKIAEDGRDLVWDHGIRPKDAIHVASALAAKANVLNTFDNRLINKNGKIGNPTLIIEPPKVKQGDLGV